MQWVQSRLQQKTRPPATSEGDRIFTCVSRKMISREDCPGVGRTLNVRMSVLRRDRKGENRDTQRGAGRSGRWQLELCDQNPRDARSSQSWKRDGGSGRGGWGVVALEPLDEAQPHQHRDFRFWPPEPERTHSCCLKPPSLS